MPLLVAVLATALARPAAVEDRDSPSLVVPLHHPFVVSLAATHGTKDAANSFKRTVSVTATHSGTGLTRTVGAYYDGGHVWRARFTCSHAGRWEWVSEDMVHRDPGLMQTGQVVCGTSSNSTAHGALQVDASNPHHFVWEDGTRFFPVSLELDWLYALGLEADTTPVSLEDFLDSLAPGHFNEVVVNFYVNHSSWDHAPPQYHMQTHMTPWASADQMTLNLEYFQHYDTVIEALLARGIVAHIMFMAENKFVNWPAEQSPADDLYWTTIVNRYQGYSNVVWDVSKEAHRLPASYWATRFALIEAKDSHHRLRTVHTCETCGDGSFVPLEQKDCQFISHQQHSDYHNHILRVRQQFPTKPVMNIEFLYEMGQLKTYGPQSRPDDMRLVLWAIQMAGGYANWYVSTTAWDVIVPGDVTPGYAYCRHVREFFNKTQYWLLQPNDSLVNTTTGSGSAYALASPTEMAVYLESAAPFRLQVPSGQWSGEWFDPRTAQTQAVNVTGGSIQTLTPPKFYDASSDVALHIEKS